MHPHLGRLARLALLALPALFAAPLARAATWDDVTAATIGTTAEWSNKVELADLDGDGHLDILFANGGNYSSPGTPEPLRVFRGDGAGGFTEITTEVFGDATFLARAVKVRDVTGDGRPDVLIATTYQTQSRLFVADGRGGFVDRTADLPQAARSFGDVELGDVDGDGDLDAVLADWGPGDPLSNGGGQPRLWLNDGAGRFTDATDARVPTKAIGMSWDLELLDVDSDRDLDVLVSCKVCDGSTMLRNDGFGTFEDASDGLPQFGNNYEFEAMDLDGDGRPEVVTINDGPGLTEHVFRGGGVSQGFSDVTDARWPDAANLGEDDNMVAFLDVDDDGDSDFVIGSLSGADRVLLNDGAGNLSLGDQTFGGAATPGTLGIAVGDLNEDGRLDVVHSQGEVAFDDRVYFATTEVPVDTHGPVIVELRDDPFDTATTDIVARIHDRHTPVRLTDFQSVELVVERDGVEERIPMEWYGEALFRADFELGAPSVTMSICATDRYGNESCSQPRVIPVAGEDAGPFGDGGTPGEGDGGGCGCRTTTDAATLGTLALLALAAALTARRRR